MNQGPSDNVPLVCSIQFAPQIFQVMGMGVRASLMSSLITNAVNMGATLVAIFTVDRCWFNNVG